MRQNFINSCIIFYIKLFHTASQVFHQIKLYTELQKVILRGDEQKPGQKCFKKLLRKQTERFSERITQVGALIAEKITIKDDEIKIGHSQEAQWAAYKVQGSFGIGDHRNTRGMIIEDFEMGIIVCNRITVIL